MLNMKLNVTVKQTGGTVTNARTRPLVSETIDHGDDGLQLDSAAPTDTHHILCYLILMENLI